MERAFCAKKKKLHYDFSLIRIQLSYSKHFGHMAENRISVRHIVAGITVNDKHEFTQGWKTASDWSAVDEWNWLIESADVRGGENS